MSPSLLALKAVSIAAPVCALTTSTMILGFSILQTPILMSTTAQSSPSLALRQLRPYFETGKYIFPPMSLVSAVLFGILAYHQPEKLASYALAIGGCLSILPFTSLYMIPQVNNRILELDDKTLAGEKENVDAHRKEIKTLLERFARQNLVRGGMFWLGSVYGLWTILS